MSTCPASTGRRTRASSAPRSAPSPSEHAPGTGRKTIGPPMRRVPADAVGARAAAEVLVGGGGAVLPTDTVYGLAARPGDAEAVRAVFRAKDRPEGMPLPVLAATRSQVLALGVAFTAGAEALARR